MEAQQQPSARVMPDDIEAETALYGDAPEARTIVEALLAGAKEPVRVTRCVLHLAGTDLEKLRQYAETARTDYRDVIWWAEYDGGGRPRRDFNKPMR